MDFILRYAYAAIACLYLFTIGALFPRNRLFISRISTRFGYGPKSTQPILPSVGLSDIAPDGTPIRVLEPISVAGNVSLLELVVIARLIRRHGPRRLFEVGTFDGRTTLNMAANSAEDTRVFTLDLPRHQIGSTRLPLAPRDTEFINKDASGARFLGTDYERRITQLYGDSATFDFSPFFGNIDFVFVDGSHSYENVLNDSERARRMLRDGKGVILWHDYGGWEGVTKGLHKLFSDDGDAWRLRHVEGTTLVCLIAE